MARALKSFAPLFDRVLVQRFAAETKTKGGLLIPEKSQGKMLDAKVVAVGPGIHSSKGDLIPVNVSVGDRVILPEYGGTKVVLDEQEYFLFRNQDILGKIQQ